MAHLADIPPEFLNPNAKDQFIAWLRGLPVPVGVKRSLIKAWRRETRSEWSAADYRRALS